MANTVSIVDAGAFVRVSESTSDGYVLFNKNNSRIEKTNDQYLTLRDGESRKYIVYAEVTQPVTSSVDDLVTTVSNFVASSQNDTSQNEGPQEESLSQPQKDLFGDLRIVQKKTTIDVKSTFGISVLRDVVSVEGTGSVTNPVGNPEYAIEVTGQGAATLQTVERGRYVAGTSAEIGIGMRMSTTSFSGNQRATWGYTDGSDGFFFYYTSGGVGVAVLRDGVETAIDRSAWNVDRMDGSGPSGKVYDPTQGVIYQVMYSWYGYGQIAFRIVVTDMGKQFVQTVHRFVPNGQTSVKNPNLPISITVENPVQEDAANEQPIMLYVAGRQYSILGDVINISSRLTNSYVLDVPVSSDGLFSSVLNIRRKSNYLGNPIRINGIDIITNAICIFQLRINGVNIGVGDEFGIISDTLESETALEQNTTARTTNTSGLILYSGFAFGNAGNGNKPDAIDVANRSFDYVIEENQVISMCIRALNEDLTCSVIIRFTEGW